MCPPCAHRQFGQPGGQVVPSCSRGHSAQLSLSPPAEQVSTKVDVENCRSSAKMSPLSSTTLATARVTRDRLANGMRCPDVICTNSVGCG